MKAAIAIVLVTGCAVVLAAAPPPQSTAVPIGAVIDWWRPNASFAIPTGYQVADGSTVTDTGSPLMGTQLPDLRNKFVRGANGLAGIGATGGAAQHTHTATPPTVTANGGGHHHSWANTSLDSAGKLRWISRSTAGPELLVVWNNGIGDAGAGNFPLSVSQGKVANFITETGREVTQIQVPTFTTRTAANDPLYVGLLKIVRVK
jgi:hypothetical protein